MYRRQDPRGCDSLWRLEVVVRPNVGPVVVSVQSSVGDTLGGVLIQGDTTFTVRYATAIGGCDSLVQYEVRTSSVSTREARVVGSLQVYPVPVRSGADLMVVLPGGGTGGEVSLLDVLGRIQVRASAQGAEEVRLSTAYLPSGPYVVRYVEEGSIWQAQVVVD